MAVSPEPLPPRRDWGPRDARTDDGENRDELRALAAENQRLLAELDRLRESSQSERLERDDFLSYTAHELRTPLTLIFGYTQTVARRMRDRPEAARDLGDLERVIAATRRLSGMVDELLDVSRVETSRFRLSIRPFSLATAAQDAISRAPASQPIHLETPSDLPLALGDEAKVVQVLWILLRNALHVTPTGLPVRVALGATHRELAATVEDRGPAISDEALPRLFEVSHVYPSAVDKREGLGLGLFVAQGMARALGGDVRFERPTNAASRGNCFVLTIPRADPEPVHLAE